MDGIAGMNHFDTDQAPEYAGKVSNYPMIELQGYGSRR